VLFVSVSDAIFEFTVLLGQLCGHDVDSARRVYSSARTILYLLTEIEFMHHSYRSLVGMNGRSFQFGRAAASLLPAYIAGDNSLSFAKRWYGSPSLLMQYSTSPSRSGSTAVTTYKRSVCENCTACPTWNLYLPTISPGD
jgi:hypothetical protein